MTYEFRKLDHSLPVKTQIESMKRLQERRGDFDTIGRH